jgi:putative peptidoglycan lipid II flippase
LADGPTPEEVPQPGQPAEDPPGPASIADDAAPASPAEAEAEASMDVAAVEDARARGTARQGRSAAGLVAAGIFLSRMMGLVRESAIGFFFGLGPHADVFRVALKTPNFLQNLLGEGTISAAFIPTYSRMIEEGRRQAAGRFAGAILGLLIAVTAAVVIAGILLARPVMTLLLPGWLADDARVAAGELSIDRFELVVDMVRITFPMAGVLVLSAWALGVLNSHRKFFLPYVAPVFWNVAIVAGLAVAAFGMLDVPAGALASLSPEEGTRVLVAGLIGALIGGVLQFGVQLPGVFREIRGFRPSLSREVEGVRPALRAFWPVVLGRGAYQVSGYIDTFLAGFLAAGAVAAQNAALVLYLLPISLFGMSVAASELPELSRISAEQRAAFLDRVERSLRQILFLVIPTAVGYLAFGLLVIGAFYERGAWGPADTWLVYLVLGAYTVGLVATTATRLIQNAFYALDDTKTPARIAFARLALSAVSGAALMLMLDAVALGDVIDLPPGGRALRLGSVGLAIGAAAGAWLEVALMARALRRRDASFALPWAPAGRMAALACVAAIPAAGAWWLLPVLPIVVDAAAVLAVYAGSYLWLAGRLGFEEREAWIGRLRRR